MSSTLKVNTLTGVSTAGSIAVTGEGNSTTTNLQQGLAKVWCKFQGDDTTDNDKFAVSTTDDDNTGYHGVNFSINFATIHYATHSTTAHNYGASNDGWSSGVASSDGEAGMTTSSVQLSHGASSGSNADPTAVHVTIFGDLA